MFDCQYLYIYISIIIDVYNQQINQIKSCRMPGTNWCGKGWRTDSFNKLGGYSSADRFTSKYLFYLSKNLFYLSIHLAIYLSILYLFSIQYIFLNKLIYQHLYPYIYIFFTFIYLYVNAYLFIYHYLILSIHLSN